MQDRLEIEVHRVNERFFELLTDSAQHDTQPVFSLVNTIRRELGALDRAALLSHRLLFSR